MNISVIIPVYKTEAYLCQCVDSLLAQTYQDFELILVDDGSPDHCGEICDEYASKDSRIYVLHRENGGLSAARNTALDWVFKNSESRWITFVDSDDWVHPEYLQSLLLANEVTHSLISICGYMEAYTRKPPNIAEGQLQIKSISPEMFWCKKPVNATIAWGKLYAKDCFKHIRYPEGKLHEDEFVTYQILFSQNHVSIIEPPLYYYFQNPESIMHSSWSPRRLVVLDALDNQIQFFQTHGYVHAQESSARGYAIWCAQRLRDLDEEKYKGYRRIIRQRFQKMLFLNRRILPLNEYRNQGFYESAFPLTMKGYHAIGGFLRRIGVR